MPNEYWSKRVLKQSEMIYDKTLGQMQQQLAVYYKQALQDVQADISTLWDTMLEESLTGEIKANDLYRFNRYYDLQAKINSKLKSLGNNEVDINNKNYTKMYNKIGEVINGNIPEQYINQAYVILPDDRVKQVLDSIWCADGKNWSTRIWDNKTLLQQHIEKGLLDSVSRGVPKDKVVEQLMKDFNVGFSMADRIARTELAHVQNTASSDNYKQAGIQRVKTIVAHDERLCDICSAHDKEIHNIDDAVDGVAYLFHAQCRCAIIGIVD